MSKTFSKTVCGGLIENDLLVPAGDLSLLSAGTHTLTVDVGVNGVQFYGFRVCTEFIESRRRCCAVHALAQTISMWMGTSVSRIVA